MEKPINKPSIETASKNLKDFKAILDELGVVFCLDGGTLLGAYRDGNFCADDQDDMDLTTLHDPAVINDIVERASAIGFTVCHVWLMKDKTSAQIAMRRNGAKVDLMFKRLKGDRAFWTVYKKDSVVYKSVPAFHYTELAKINFLGEDFCMPSQVEDYLALRYGDWKTPVHRSKYSCYTSDKVIVENYEAI